MWYIRFFAAVICGVLAVIIMQSAMERSSDRCAKYGRTLQQNTYPMLFSCYVIENGRQVQVYPR